MGDSRAEPARVQRTQIRKISNPYEDSVGTRRHLQVSSLPLEVPSYARAKIGKKLEPVAVPREYALHSTSSREDDESTLLVDSGDKISTRQERKQMPVEAVVHQFSQPVVPLEFAPVMQPVEQIAETFFSMGADKNALSTVMFSGGGSIKIIWILALAVAVLLFDSLSSRLIESIKEKSGLN